MLLILRLVATVCFLAVVTKEYNVSAYHASGGYKKKLVIYTPVKYKVIHHHKLEKVPIVIKKHLHYHINEEAAKVEHHSGNHYDHFHYTLEDSGHHDHHEYESYHEDDDHHYTPGIHEFYHEDDSGDHEEFEDSHEDHETDDHHHGSVHGYIGYHKGGKQSHESFPGHFSHGDQHEVDWKHFKQGNYHQTGWKQVQPAIKFSKGNGYKIHEDFDEYSPSHDNEYENYEYE